MTALIETVRVQNGRAPLWSLHIERIRAASRALGLDVEPPVAPAGGDDRIVRYEIRPHATTTTYRDPVIPASLCLHVASIPHANYPWKTTERAGFDDAFSEARRHGADDSILLSSGGLIRECSRWALVWRRADDRIGAPPLSSGVLRSVARKRLGALLKGGLAEEELEIGRLGVTSVAVLNAARGLVAVAAIDGRKTPVWEGWSRLAARFWP